MPLQPRPMGSIGCVVTPTKSFVVSDAWGPSDTAFWSPEGGTERHAGEATVLEAHYTTEFLFLVENEVGELKVVSARRVRVVRGGE